MLTLATKQLAKFRQKARKAPTSDPFNTKRKNRLATNAKRLSLVIGEQTQVPSIPAVDNYQLQFNLQVCQKFVGDTAGR